jgi:hypothetical protein
MSFDCDCKDCCCDGCGDNRLNRTQASALVYMALVQPRDVVGSRPGRSYCDDLGSLVRRMNDHFLRDNRNRSRYLDQRERDVLLRDARDVEQAARRCDHRSAEDEARTLVRIASQRTVEREQAIRQIQRLQGIVRTASLWQLWQNQVHVVSSADPHAPEPRVGCPNV